MKLIIVTIGLLLNTALVLGQETKYIDTELLNLRSGPGTKFDVIDKLAAGDSVIEMGKEGQWSEVKSTDGKTGYVSSRFLTATYPASQNKKDFAPESDVGFEYGFYKAFDDTFIIIFFVVAGIDAFLHKRKRDGRYKTGYKKMIFSQGELLKYGIYAVIICSLIGVFMGTFYWIKSF